MKILLISIGTRGDIEPFIAQAERLQEAGHQVICQFPEQFREMVEKLGFSFLGLDKRFLEMLDSSVGKSVMGGGGNTLTKAKNFYKLMTTSFKMQSNLILQQKEAIQTIQPDRVLYHPKALYCLIPAMVTPEKYFLLCPIPCLTHPHSDFPHLGLSKWGPFSKKWNLRTYKWVNSMRYVTFRKFLKPHFADFPGVDFSNNAMEKFELTQLQTLYQISPTLFPRPENWPVSAQVVGYFARNQVKDYQPDPELVQWLARFPKAILVTFGSMSNPKPKEYSRKIIEILEKYEIPAIVNLSWGGLEKVEGSSDRLFYVNQIPYDWVLPQLHGMVHHGGSGTLHYGAKSGVVQLIVPHIMDQYFWNRLIFNLGLGPNGTSIHNFDASKFEHLLLDFWTNPNYSIQAKKIAAQMENDPKFSEVLKLLTT